MDTENFMQSMIDAQADQAETTIDYYYTLAECDDDNEQALAWFLCNARHWCDREGIVWDAIMARANDYYADEIERYEVEKES